MDETSWQEDPDSGLLGLDQDQPVYGPVMGRTPPSQLGGWQPQGPVVTWPTVTMLLAVALAVLILLTWATL